MFEKFITVWDNCVNNVNDFFTSYRSGDPIMIKKNVNINLSLFKRSDPDKKIMGITVEGEPETTLMDAIVFLGIVTACVSIVGLISRAFKR